MPRSDDPRAKSPATDKDDVIKEIPAACSDELTAVEFLERKRWGDSVGCPRCGDTDVYKMTDRATGGRHKRFLWRCNGCKQQYTVRIGTIFEDSRIPLRHWCYAFWAACSSKKGVSALQIKRMTGLSYKSALFLMHRIRFAMADGVKGPLSGDVEVDETYVGGKPRKWSREQWLAGYQTGQRRKRRTRPLMPVLAMVERGGRVSTQVMPTVTGYNIKQVLLDRMAPSSRLLTDDSVLYTKIGKPFAKHETVKHTINEYARGDVHTNTVEGFFSLLKRGIFGTFHAVSPKHLHRYCSEFEFRYNSRKMTDGERLELVLRQADGKRLMYRTPLA